MTTVEQVAAEFESIGVHPETARGNCTNESFRFVLALQDAGIEAERVSGFKFIEYEGHACVLDGHTAVRVGDTVFDWTARQFPPHDQAFPLVVPYDEWRAEWPTAQEGIDNARATA